MGVDLRRGDVGMAEHLLDRTQVGAAFQQVRREGVTQQVRLDGHGDAGALRRHARQVLRGHGDDEQRQRDADDAAAPALDGHAAEDHDGDGVQLPAHRQVGPRAADASGQQDGGRICAGCRY